MKCWLAGAGSGCSHDELKGVVFNCSVKQHHVSPTGILRAWGWEMLPFGSHLAWMHLCVHLYTVCSSAVNVIPLLDTDLGSKIFQDSVTWMSF